MPPKARSVSTAVKRKSREDDEPEESVKRTRSRGAPTHFVPLVGAPDASDAARPRHLGLSTSPRKTARTVLEPVQLPNPPHTLKSRSPTKLAATDDRSTQNSSDDELSMPSPSKPAVMNTPKSVPQKSRDLIAEVQISSRRPIIKTYKKSRAPTRHPPSESDENEVDELLLQPSPSRPKSTPATAPSRSALRTHTDSHHSSARDQLSPTKRARFAQNFPHAPLADEAQTRDADENSSPINQTPTRQRVRKGPLSVSASRTLKLINDDPESEGEPSEGQTSPSKSTRSSRKLSGKSNSIFSAPKLPQKLPGSIKKPNFAASPSKRLVSDTEEEDEAAAGSGDEADALPTRLRQKQTPSRPLPTPRGRANRVTEDVQSGDRPISPPLPGLTLAEDGLPQSTRLSNPRLSVSPDEPSVLPDSLPDDLRPLFDMQKRVTRQALARPHLPARENSNAKGGSDAVSSLLSLLQGTALRGEGNSCIVLGPRRSGKTLVIDEAISQIEKETSKARDSSAHPIVIRLSGHVHTNDRLALREIGRQLLLQNGPSELDLANTDGEDEDPDDDEDEVVNDDDDSRPTILTSQLPPPSHMSSLITTMSSLPRPTIVILDAFDLFTTHARQALLYCLLDTVQSCRAGEGRKGVAVVGVTTRVDTLNLLEKRVKSRFSHRIIRCHPPTSLNDFIDVSTAALTKAFTLNEAKSTFPKLASQFTSQRLDSWRTLWQLSIETCLASREVKRLFKEIFELARDVDLMNSILLTAFLDLKPANPWVSAASLISASRVQRYSDPWGFLPNLTFPSLALLVASFHVQTIGHDAFTFEHVFDVYSRAARSSTNTNVSLDGVVVGLPRLPREILIGAFQNLIDANIFQPSGASSTSTSFQFLKYRCDVPRPDVKAAIEAKSHTQLKRWLTRPT